MGQNNIVDMRGSGLTNGGLPQADTRESSHCAAAQITHRAELQTACKDRLQSDGKYTTTQADTLSILHCTIKNLQQYNTDAVVFVKLLYLLITNGP